MQIGFIGLGMMGAGMASNLQKAGHQLIVHDLSRQAASRHLANGATWAESPRAVAERWTSCSPRCRRRPMSRRSARARTACCRVSARAPPGSTCPPTRWTWCAGCTRNWRSRAWTFLDAPVSGGPSGANSGRLAIWVGGDKAVFDKYKPVLDAMGDAARYIGPIGAGSIAKLVHNAAGAAVSTVLAEVFTMGVKAGVEPLPLWEAIRQGAGGRARLFDRMSGRLPHRHLRSAGFRAAAAAQGRVARLPAGARGRRADAADQPRAPGADRGAGPRLGAAGLARRACCCSRSAPGSTRSLYRRTS